MATDYKLKLRASVIGSRAAMVIANSKEGKVHSCFKRTLNLSLEKGLVGVTSSRAPRSPINIHVDLPNGVEIGTFGVKTGCRVIIERSSLAVSNYLCVLLDEADIWIPSKIVDQASLEIVRHNIQLLQRFLHFVSIKEGFGAILPLLPKILEQGKFKELSVKPMQPTFVLEKIIEIVKSIRERDLDSLGRCCKGVLGLGLGATPSGDDLLIGLMASLQWTVRSLGGDVRYVNAICNEIYSRCSTTTELSKTLLSCASRGEVNEVIEDVLRSLLSRTENELTDSLAELLKMGETSGVDTLAGIYLGTSLGLELL